MHTGENRYFYLSTNYYDNDNIFNTSGIEENIEFKTVLYQTDYQSRKYDTTCILWKPKNDNLKLFCQIIDSYGGSNYVNLNQTVFLFKSCIIFIDTSPSFYLKYVNQRMPFLYADEQKITITEGKELYQLKFNMIDYYNELLYLYSNDTYIPLDKCSEEDDNLICVLEKEDIEEVLQKNITIFKTFLF